MVKSFKFIIKTIFFEGLASCVRERKRYQKNSNKYTKIHPTIDDKSMRKLWVEIDATKIENHQKWNRKGSQQP